jgi:hypothetical protein
LEKHLTERAVNTVKDKVKRIAAEAIKDFKRKGRTVPKASPEEVPLFPSALGRYVKEKQIPIAI